MQGLYCTNHLPHLKNCASGLLFSPAVALANYMTTQSTCLTHVLKCQVNLSSSQQNQLVKKVNTSRNRKKICHFNYQRELFFSMPLFRKFCHQQPLYLPIQWFAARLWTYYRIIRVLGQVLGRHAFLKREAHVCWGMVHQAHFYKARTVHSNFWICCHISCWIESSLQRLFPFFQGIAI